MRSCRCTALPVAFLLFLFGGQSIAGFLSAVVENDLPEVDGSAVDTCGIFPLATTETATTETTATTTEPVTRKVVITTKKPTVKTTTRKPATKTTRRPVRPQPAPAGPSTDRRPNLSLSQLLQLLNNRRRQAGRTQPGSNRVITRPVRKPSPRRQSSSESNEEPSTGQNRAGRAGGNRRRVGSFSSEDASDES